MNMLTLKNASVLKLKHFAAFIGILCKHFLRITYGLFISDQNLGMEFRVLQVVSRLSWELPQTIAGFIYNQVANLLGKVHKVSYFGGATVIYGAAPTGHAMALGTFISMGKANKNNEKDFLLEAGAYTFMHEYGHYLQSRRNGIVYLFKYGLPSIWRTEWTEWDANQRAANYFNEISGFVWNPNYYKAGTYMHRYSKLPKNGTLRNAKLIEYILLPLLPFFNLKKPL